MTRYVDDFLSQHPKSAKTYSQVLREAAFVIHKPIEEFTHEDVVDYRNALEDMMPNTVKKKMAALRSFFKYLGERRIRTDNPMWGISTVKVDSRATARFLDMEEQRKLILGVTDNRDRAVIWMLLHGLRLEEVERLNVEDWQQGLITPGVLRVTGKGDKVRSVPLEPMARDALNDYLKGRTWGSMFWNYKGERLGRQTIQDTCYRVTQKVLGKRINPHALRHSFASRLEEQGLSLSQIKELMGHSSTAITDIYVHLSPRSLVEAIEAHPLIEAETPRLRLIQGGSPR